MFAGQVSKILLFMEFNYLQFRGFHEQLLKKKKGVLVKTENELACQILKRIYK